jgi:hypothetical protein
VSVIVHGPVNETNRRHISLPVDRRRAIAVDGSEPDEG